MAETPTNLGARTASGTVWMASQTIITRFTSLFTQLLLAKLLLPEQFGQIGLVYTISAFAIQLTNPGVDDVLLQKQKHLYRWTTAAFWMGLACSLAGAVLMVLSAIIVVNVAKAFENEAYGDPILVRLVAILACAAVLGTGMLVPSVILRSEMRFAKLASIGFGDAVFQQILTLVFAALGFGVYSFVLPSLIANATRLALLWAIVRPRIRWQLSLHRWPSLISAGGWIFGQRLMVTTTSQGDYMLIAAIYADKVLVGYYFFAFMLSIQVMRLLCENAGAALTPALNAIRDDSQRMWNAVQRAAGALATMVVPIAAIQIVLAGPVIRLLFAAKWEPAIPMFRWLSAGPLFFWAIWPLSSVLTVTGRFRDNFLVWLIGTVAFFLIVAPATWFGGAVGTAAAVACWCWIMPIIYSVTIHGSISQLHLLLKSAGVPWLAAAAGGIPSAILVALLPNRTGYDVLAIAVATPLMLAAYFLILMRFDRNSLDALMSHAPGALRPLLRIFGRKAVA